MTRDQRMTWDTTDLVLENLTASSDTGDTVSVGRTIEGVPMSYRIEENYEGCTPDLPFALLEITEAADDVEEVTVVDTFPDQAAAQAHLDSLENETAGGKPNEGTKKDKRLKTNKSALAQAVEFARRQRTGATGGAVTMTLRVTDATPVATQTTTTAAASVALAAPASAAWKGVICVEGILSGDQREFSKNALTWAELPIPLRWKKEDAHGGVNDVTVAVGTITKIKRSGSEIQAEGVFDMGSEDGREAHRRVGDGFLAGISIDADDITDADIEFVWPETEAADGEEVSEADIFDMLFASPEKIVFHAGRIRAATLCDIPAFVEARIALTAAGEVEIPEGLVAAAVLDAQVREATEGLTAAATLNRTVADAPPRAWFDDPKLSVPMNIIVTDEGRVYGHAAHWSECHIGHPDMCITAPYEDSHPYFATGELVCADGSRVQVGQITLATGHAPLPYGAQKAAEHYDNTGTAVADISIGNDEHGIWVAGAVRPGVDPARVRELRASGKVSGDWRRIAGSLRMVGLLAVNVAGFQTPQVRSRVAGGQQMALVAAGQPKVGQSNSDVEAAAMRFLMDRAAKRIRQA